MKKNFFRRVASGLCRSIMKRILMRLTLKILNTLFVMIPGILLLIFWGNSNWRGPVWIPINYILIQSIRKYGEFYGDDLLVECPTGSGIQMNLKQVADELAKGLLVYLKKMRKVIAEFMVRTIGFISSRAMNTSFYFMNIFMEIMVTGLEQAIKQGGRRWWQG